MAVVRRFGDVGEVDAYLSTVMGKGNFCNVGDLTIGVHKIYRNVDFRVLISLKYIH